MTIDERLEKLTERHEALPQTVEIIAAMQRENERRMAELRETVARHEETWHRLANIVIRHEERLDALDGGDAE
jgi:predicted nuclease with TOPRIM domain